jgi:type II secretory ATPase GspE/PulE/Tfp pilus assembly ATPase PilB-like protein
MPIAMLAEGFFLVSIWKPLLLLLPFVGWAWVISKVYDKHAARFHLARNKWNLIHLILGLAALAAALFLPMKSELTFWLGWLLMSAILGTSLAAYMYSANKDERVPASNRIKIGMPDVSSGRAEKAAAKRQGKVEFTFRLPDKTTLPVPDKEAPEFETRVAAEGVISQALTLRALQADIGPTGKDNTYAVTYLVDGVRHPGTTMPAPMGLAVTDIWKAAAKLDLADKRKRQQGDTTLERGTDKHKVRVTTVGAQAGVRTTLMLEPEKSVKRKPDDFGFTEAQLAEIKAMVADAQGVVLLAAAPDNGRTSTMYGLLKMHDAYTSNVQTVEMEPMDALEGIRQNIFDPASDGPEYSTLVRSILRRDPQVVGVAETPDDATAKEVSRVDIERTRIYLSIAADSAMGAIQKWVKAVGDLEGACKPLHGVIAQKLVRKLCVNCRQAYPPTPDMLKKLGIPANAAKQLYKKGGQVLNKSNKPEICPVCNGIGYNLQEGCFEVYSFGEAERALLKSGNEAALRAELRKKQLPTIQQSALKKAIDGITSVEEVLRVTVESGGGGGAGGASVTGAGPKPGPGGAPKAGPAGLANAKPPVKQPSKP